MQQIPDIVYKYKPLNEFTLKILTDFELYLPSISQLNDPFEGAIPFVYDSEELTPENIFLKMYDTTKRNHPDWNETEIHEFVFEEYKKGNLFNEQHLAKHIKETRDDIERRFGILSLTSKKNNFLMWSHYGDSHKGMCIGFDSKALQETIKGTFGPTEYQKELPKFSLFEQTLDFTIKLLFTKSSVWEYEEEFRISKIDAARKTYKLPENAIKEIILGTSMCQSKKNEIVSLVSEHLPDASMFDTSLNDKTFEIDLMQIR